MYLAEHQIAFKEGSIHSYTIDKPKLSYHIVQSEAVFTEWVLCAFRHRISLQMTVTFHSERVLKNRANSGTRYRKKYYI